MCVCLLWEKGENQESGKKLERGVSKRKREREWDRERERERERERVKWE